MWGLNEQAHPSSADTVVISQTKRFHMNAGSEAIFAVNSLAQGQIQGDKELKTRKKPTPIFASQQVLINAFALQNRVVCSHSLRMRGASVSPGQHVHGDPRRQPDGSTSGRENFWTICVCAALLISGHVRRRSRPSRHPPLRLYTHPIWAGDFVLKHKHVSRTLVHIQENVTFFIPVNKSSMNAFRLQKSIWKMCHLVLQIVFLEPSGGGNSGSDTKWIVCIYAAPPFLAVRRGDLRVSFLRLYPLKSTVVIGKHICMHDLARKGCEQIRMLVKTLCFTIWEVISDDKAV